MQPAQVSNLVTCTLIKLCNDSQAATLSWAVTLLSSQVQATRQTAVVAAAVAVVVVVAVVGVAVVVNTIITIVITVAIAMCRF